MAQHEARINTHNLMNSKLPVLEYSAVGTAPGKKARWAFRFKTPEGEVLMESALSFASKAEAERGFISLIKSVARNAYLVAYSEHAANGCGSSHRPTGRCRLKRQTRFSVSGSGSKREFEAGGRR